MLKGSETLKINKKAVIVGKKMKKQNADSNKKICQLTSYYRDYPTITMVLI